MVVSLALLVGFLASRLGWLLLRPVLAQPVFARENYRGHMLPTAAGLVLVVALLTVEATRLIAAAILDDASRLDGRRTGVLVLVAGLGLLGFVDDLAGGPDHRGFRGHLRAVAEGRPTTGALKLLGGAAVALLAVAIARPRSGLGQLLVDGAVIALAANLGNLFDRAPGRAIKVGAFGFFLLLVLTRGDNDLAAAAVVVGAALALLRDDLSERLMLGDTGANALGGAAGFAVVVATTQMTRAAVLVVLLLLNGVAEWVSFSRVIDAVPPLRVIDRAGRRAHR